MYSPALTKRRITANEKNKKIFHSNIVNDNYKSFLNDESTPSKGTVNTKNRHIVKKI